MECDVLKPAIAIQVHAKYSPYQPPLHISQTPPISVRSYPSTSHNLSTEYSSPRLHPRGAYLTLGLLLCARTCSKFCRESNNQPELVSRQK